MSSSEILSLRSTAVQGSIGRLLFVFLGIRVCKQAVVIVVFLRTHIFLTSEFTMTGQPFSLLRCTRS